MNGKLFQPCLKTLSKELDTKSFKVHYAIKANANNIFIAPGVYLAGVKGKELAVASVLGSVGVSLSLVAYFLMTPDYTTDLC